jgi:hypothetical protein
VEPRLARGPNPTGRLVREEGFGKRTRRGREEQEVSVVPELDRSERGRGDARGRRAAVEQGSLDCLRPA